MAIYKSEYTGAETDFATGRVLGGKYQESETPGCHAIGQDVSNPQNLYEVVIPGKYTILFYYDMDSAGNTIDMAFEGNSPIFLQVTYDGNCHYQRITIGAALYWRDLASNDYTWKYVNMGVEKTIIIDNLTSTLVDAALSANQGRVLKDIIDGLTLGNLNLAENTALRRSIECWNISAGNITRDTTVTYKDLPTFRIDGSTLASTTDFLAITSLAKCDAYADANKSYTASVWVKAANVTGASVFVQITFAGTDHQAVSGIKREVVIDSSTQWQQIKVSCKAIENGIKYVKIVFGVTNNSVANFALPKLEEGDYATQWMPSRYDMWSEFDNANFINEIFTDIEDIRDHQGIIYSGTEEKFINEYLAVGGGGGFVQSDTEPENHEVLWYNLSDNGGKFYRYDSTTSQWSKAIPNYFAQQLTSPTDTERGWLDTNDVTTIKPATLKYYDTSTNSWRPVGAAPSANWVFSETAPEDREKMWILIPTMVAHLYYDGAWVPLHAIWGSNVSQT